MDDRNVPDLVSTMTSLLQVPNVTVAWSVRFSNGLVLECIEMLPMEAGSTFKALVAAECCRLV